MLLPKITIRRERFFLLAVPPALLLLASLMLCGTSADLALCRLFHGGEYLSWPYLDGKPSTVINFLTPYPAYLLAGGGFVMALLGWFSSRLRPWRKDGLFLVLLLALGPGLLINGVIKPLWGRPRPEETTAFGGSREYRPIWSVDLQSTSKSFPSGHAGAGFYLIAPAFLIYRRSRRLALVAGFLGAAYGTLVGLTRMMQGQHFPSDILWSAAIVYFVGLILYVALDIGRNRPQPTEVAISPRRDVHAYHHSDDKFQFGTPR